MPSRESCRVAASVRSGALGYASVPPSGVRLGALRGRRAEWYFPGAATHCALLRRAGSVPPACGYCRVLEGTVGVPPDTFGTSGEVLISARQGSANRQCHLCLPCAVHLHCLAVHRLALHRLTLPCTASRGESAIMKMAWNLIVKRFLI